VCPIHAHALVFYHFRFFCRSRRKVMGIEQYEWELNILGRRKVKTDLK
jgi:hypothetical protein